MAKNILVIIWGIDPWKIKFLFDFKPFLISKIEPFKIRCFWYDAY